MKHYRLFLLLGTVLVSSWSTSLAQEQENFEPHGKVSATIYSDYSTSFTSEEVTSVGFNVERTYFGYTYFASENFFAEVKLDISAPNDVTSGSLRKRVAHIRNAYGTFLIDNSTSISFGMVNLETSNIQEKMWGHRYLYKTFMDEHKFGHKTDLGIVLRHTVNEQLNVDIAVSNNEGYGSVQKDLDFLYGFGATITPTPEFTLRLYGDYSNLSNKPITLSSFISINPFESNWSWNAEYNYKINNNGIKDHNLAGLSLYTTYTFTNAVGVFARYDKLWSNVLDEDFDPWNHARDGNAIVGGVEYIPTSNLRVSLAYSGWIFDNSALEAKNKIGIYTEIKF